MQIEGKFENIGCPLCAGRDYLMLYRISCKEFQITSPFYILKCQNCKLVYLNPRIKKGLARQYYPSSYYQTEKSNSDKILKTPYEIEKIRLMKYFGLLKNKEKSLLDIGCNKGEFLENLKRLGWRNLKGVEFNADCAEFAKRQYNLDIFAGEFEDYPEDEKFDIVTFWHSLEHLYDINGAIEKSGKLLKQDGMLVISVPNIKSLQANMMGKYWYHLDIPRHTVFFDRYMLQKLLQDHNFARVDYTYKYPSHNLDGWYNSFLAMWNDFRCNTSKTKTSQAADFCAKKLSYGKLTLLKILKEFMRILSYIEMSIGLGGTIAVAAKKIKKDSNIY